MEEARARAGQFSKSRNDVTASTIPLKTQNPQTQGPRLVLTDLSPEPTEVTQTYHREGLDPSPLR